MAKAELGTKRIDPETGRKFYDLGKDPIVSPYTGKSYPRTYFESATAIVVLVLLGQVLELRARGRTSSAIRKLLGLAPKTARVVRPGGREEDVPLETVQVGDVLAGRVPVIFRGELYATPALAGAFVAVLMDRADLPFALAAATGATVCLVWRLLALWRGWEAPTPRGSASV